MFSFMKLEQTMQEKNLSWKDSNHKQMLVGSNGVVRYRYVVTDGKGTWEFVDLIDLYWFVLQKDPTSITVSQPRS